MRQARQKRDENTVCFIHSNWYVLTMILRIHYGNQGNQQCFLVTPWNFQMFDPLISTQYTHIHLFELLKTETPILKFRGSLVLRPLVSCGSFPLG
jgi:hypothetical protein